MVRTWCVLFIVTWKRDSCHNGVQFFISHLIWPRLRTRRFSEPTFRPSRPANHWKTIVLPDFPNISPTCFFFLVALSLSLSLFYSSFFCSSLLWYSSPFYPSLLCFSSLHIVGSLTAKFPWIKDSNDSILQYHTTIHYYPYYVS